MTNICPCGSHRPYAQCCGPLIAGETGAATPEQLMRSRYTAYTLENWRYLYKTWHPQTRPTRKELSRSPATQWLKLEIIKAEGDKVEFTAHFREGEQTGVLHEISRFERLPGGWVYVEGDISPATDA